MTEQPSRRDSMAAFLLADNEGLTWEQGLEELHGCRSMKRVYWWQIAKAALAHIPHLPPMPEQARSAPINLHGWMPPVIYDAVNNNLRAATQTDVDCMERTIGALRSCFNDIRTAVDRCKDDLDQAQGGGA